MKELPPPSAQPIEEILKLQDEAFVRGAYRAILGRVPDPDGLEHYLSQVRAGVRKSRILAELVHSPEGAARTPDTRNVVPLMRKYVKQVISLGAEWLRRLTDSSTDRHLRIVDNRLYLVEQAVEKQAGQMGELLSLLHEGTLRSADRRSGVRPFDFSEEHTASASPLSPGVARTYTELKIRIAKKSSE